MVVLIVDAASLAGGDWAKAVPAISRLTSSAKDGDGVRRIRIGSRKTITLILGIWLSDGASMVCE